MSIAPSAHESWANQVRVLIAALAYILVQAIRSIALAGTGFAPATAATICLHLLKIGAIVWRNTRRVRLKLSSHYPHRQLLAPGIHGLRPG